MGMSTGKKTGAMSDPNVTPLVDVMLVLLIIFMVVTPLTQKGLDVELPERRTMSSPHRRIRTSSFSISIPTGRSPSTSSRSTWTSSRFGSATSSRLAPTRRSS
jgi:biopolymer transport protein ExbD